MQLSVRFHHASEAERLRTAVFRFAEARGRSARLPTLRTEDKAGAVVEFENDQAAEDFGRYWSQFRAETMSWSGFRDV